MACMNMISNEMYPNFLQFVKEHGGGTNCRNVRLWLQFCIRTETITMSLY